MSDEQPTALGYTRLSQDSDTSIDDQKQEIRELADEHGFDLLRIFNDGERSSGFNAERPEYLQMQAYLEDEDVDALIVRNRDRLSRDKRERSMLLYDLEEWGVDLWTTVDGARVDISNDEDWLMEMIHAYMDDVAKRKEIAKAQKKVNERLENGWYHGRPPFGFRFNGAKTDLEPDPEEYPVAQRILELRDDGCSLREIGDELDDAPSRSTIRRIIDNRSRYSGAMEAL